MHAAGRPGAVLERASHDRPAGDSELQVDCHRGARIRSRQPVRGRERSGQVQSPRSDRHVQRMPWQRNRRQYPEFQGRAAVGSTHLHVVLQEQAHPWRDTAERDYRRSRISCGAPIESEFFTARVFVRISAGKRRSDLFSWFPGRPHRSQSRSRRYAEVAVDSGKAGGEPQPLGYARLRGCSRLVEPGGSAHCIGIRDLRSPDRGHAGNYRGQSRCQNRWVSPAAGFPRLSGRF